MKKHQNGHIIWKHANFEIVIFEIEDAQGLEHFFEKKIFDRKLTWIS